VAPPTLKPLRSPLTNSSPSFTKKSRRFFKSVRLQPSQTSRSTRALYLNIIWDIRNAWPRFRNSV
jgi:hypothetical protein